MRDNVARWQALLAMFAVGSGSVLIAAGPAGFVRIGTLLWHNAGWLLVGLGAVALLSAIAPLGALLGPLLLILAGVVVIRWPHPEIWTLSGGVMAAGGGIVMFGRRRPNADPVMRRSAVLLPRTVPLDAKDVCPDQLFARAVTGKLTVDLLSAPKPPRDVLEVMITCWGGWVDVRVPPHWTVVGGRLAAAHLIYFDGDLDDRVAYPEGARLPADQLTELLKECDSPDRKPALVVLHAMGFMGAVRVFH